MEIPEATAGTLLLGALGLGALAVLLAGAALLRQRQVRRAYRKFSMGSRDDVLTLLQRHIDEVRRLRSEVAGLRQYAEGLRELMRSDVSRVATVRYDAFEDMGGRLSFSTALLDEHGDGVVITSINGRTETRTYAKPLAGGHSRHNLSREEVAAIERAMGLAERTAGPDGVVPTPAERRSGQVEAQ